MNRYSSTLVVGAGIYGLTAARELVKRGHNVTVIDPGPIPHPLGVSSADGEFIGGDTVVVCAGAWTQLLVREIEAHMRASGHPVFHLRPSRPELFTPPNFSTFTADIANTGWYGFPLHPREGVVKIANHGSGREIHPRAPREVTEEEERSLRAMLADTFLSLTDAPVVYTRRCLYSDTLDENFWIDRHPEIPGLVVAAGGSGHGFKMAPVLGGIFADAVERKKNRWSEKFRWRELDPGTPGKEAARFHR